MRRILAATALMGIAAAAAQAQTTLYDNRAANFFVSGARPNRALDDGQFAPGTTHMLITGVEFAWGAPTGGGPAVQPVTVKFWNTLTSGASPVNSGFLGGFSTTVNATAGGSSGLIDLTGLPQGGIFFPDADWAVEILFADPTPLVTADNVTVGFAGGGAAVGSNLDVYWRDANGNGTFDDPSEQRTFTGGVNQANFFLRLRGSAAVAPEPGSLALLGLAALPLSGARVRRRR